MSGGGVGIIPSTEMWKWTIPYEQVKNRKTNITSHFNTEVKSLKKTNTKQTIESWLPELGKDK